MSFDLYFRGDEVPLEAIFNHFDKYPDFQRQELSDKDFGFALVNPATSVYCYFTTDQPHKEDSHVNSLCFSLNYNRPTFFALETLPLVENLCQQFQFLIEDPQEHFVGPASL